MRHSNKKRDNVAKSRPGSNTVTRMRPATAAEKYPAPPTVGEVANGQSA